MSNHDHPGHGQAAPPTRTTTARQRQRPRGTYARLRRRAVDWEALGPFLEQGAELHTPLHEQAAAWLRELLTGAGGTGPDGVRRVLDIGSGPGVVTCLLARAFPDAEVVAVDATAALLERARARAGRLGLGDRVRTHLAELPDGLDALGGADLIWSSKALHHVGDQRGRGRRPRRTSAARRAARRLRGRPRPRATCRATSASAARGCRPGSTRPREEWFTADAGGAARRRRRHRGLARLPRRRGPAHPAAPAASCWTCRPRSPPTRGTTSQANLDPQPRPFGDRLDEDDLTTLARLTDPDDAAGLTRRPDIFLLSAQTVHTARAQ